MKISKNLEDVFALIEVEKQRAFWEELGMDHSDLDKLEPNIMKKIFAENPDLARAYIEMKESDSHQKHKKQDFKKYADAWKKPSADKDDFLGVNIHPYNKAEFWPEFMEYLFDNGYLAYTALPDFFYRLTGKLVSDHTSPAGFPLIEWKKDASDLYHIFSTLSGKQVPLIKMKEFFNFALNDDVKFRGGYKVDRGLKNTLEDFKKRWK